MMPDMDGFEVCRRLKSNPVDAPYSGGHGDRARPAVRPREGARGRRRRFPDQAGSDVALIARVRSLARLKMMTDELRMRAVTSREIGIESPEREAVADTGRRARS